MGQLCFITHSILTANTIIELFLFKSSLIILNHFREKANRTIPKFNCYFRLSCQPTSGRSQSMKRNDTGNGVGEGENHSVKCDYGNQLSHTEWSGSKNNCRLIAIDKVISYLSKCMSYDANRGKYSEVALTHTTKTQTIM